MSSNFTIDASYISTHLSTETLQNVFQKCRETPQMLMILRCIRKQLGSISTGLAKSVFLNSFKEKFLTCMSRGVENHSFLNETGYLTESSLTQTYRAIFSRCSISTAEKNSNILSGNGTAYALAFTGLAIIAATAFVLYRRSSKPVSNPAELQWKANAAYGRDELLATR